MSVVVPKIIFIVPYRDRPQHLENFKTHMKTVMEDYDPETYKYLIVHQRDSRSFNRGAMKNIGFITAVKMYPKDYENITFVFNDVDNMPMHKNMIEYATTPGVIKHFYGFRYALGGIVSVLGKDFARINGFPNFWGWGYEDNMLQSRALNAGIIINRDVFFDVNDNVNILHFSHGTERNMNVYDFTQYQNKTNNGLFTIYELNYEIDDSTDFVNVINFKTPYEENKNSTFIYDLKNGNLPLNSRRKRVAMHMTFL